MRPPCLGVVREVYSKWERRAALTPAHVARVAADGVRVLVQSSPKRVFSDAEYVAAGATITEDLSPAATILGVKQPRPGSLLPDHTHMFFSHTIKGQPESMPLLDEAIQKRVRLIDYECVRAGGRPSGPRLIAFGEFAGKAGVISGFRGLGLRLLSLGHSSPLLGVGPPHSYLTYSDARRALASVGREIAEHGLPARYAPMVVAVVGRGNVSRGAVDAIDALNGPASGGNGRGTGSIGSAGPVVQWVGLDELPALSALAGTPGAHQHRVYAVLLGASDVVTKSGGGAFDKEEYYAHPERYQPSFHSTVAPHISMLVTTMYWDRRYPRLLTASQLRDLGPRETRRLLMISDLTCDVNGAVEGLTRTSTIDDPFYMHDAAAGREGPRGVDGPGVVMLGVDILPAELARESSAHFGDCLMPFLGALARCHPVPDAAMLPAAPAVASALPPELEAATITSGGQLTRRYEYIAGMRHLAQRNDSAARANAVPGSTVLSLCGHIFDSGLINRALDVVEKAGASFDLLDVQVGLPGQLRTSLP
jgi:alpha-aminoadipic semialdehyde synthase